MIPMPPDELTRIDGGSDPDIYLGYGERLYAEFKSRNLIPAKDARVFDIGCGAGRVARHMQPDPEFNGYYLGLEIDPRDVGWCKANIPDREGAEFHFIHADLKNDHYNPNGTPVEDYQFPSSSGWFDFVFLLSVFTHMKPPAIRQYLTEIARVLKPGGHCYATAFLVDDAGEVTDNEQKACYLSTDFMVWIEESGLRLVDQFKLGRQDQLVLAKPKED